MFIDTHSEYIYIYIVDTYVLTPLCALREETRVCVLPVIIDTPPKTNMTMENPPFEDAFPIENGDFPMSC